MTALRAMLGKEWRQLVRDPAGLAMLFVMPIAFIVGLSVALQGAFASPDQEERLVVCVTGDDAVQMDALVEGIRASGMFRVRGPRTGGPAGREQARRAVTDGECAVAIVVPAAMSAGIRLETAANVELIADPVLSASIVAGVESLVFQAAARASVGYLLPRSGLAGSAVEARRLIEANGPRVTRSYGALRTSEIRPNAVQQNVPAWTIFALFWLAQLLALNVLTERTSGAQDRIIVSPVSRPVYLLGKFLPFLALNLIQAATMFAVGVIVLPWFGCPRLVLGDVAGLLVLTAAVSPVVVSFGLLMASVSRSHFTVGALTATLLVLMAITGGIMVPKYLLPKTMQTMSLFLPHGWALDGYQLVLVRGAGLVDVLPQVGMLLAFAAAFFLLAWYRMPWRPR